MTQQILFFVFGAIALGAGVAVVTVRRVFHAALWLLLAFFGVAGLFVLLEAPFFAAVQLFVYMGAIGVLIIFALMLTQGIMNDKQTRLQRWWVIAVILVLYLLVAMLPILSTILEFSLSIYVYLGIVGVLLVLTFILLTQDIMSEARTRLNDGWIVAGILVAHVLVAIVHIVFAIPFNTYLLSVAALIVLTLVLGLLIESEEGTSFNEQWAMALVATPVLMVAMDYVINTIPFTGAEPPPLAEDSLFLLGMAFVSPEAFALPFEVASILLVAALLGAVVIAKER